MDTGLFCREFGVSEKVATLLAPKIEFPTFSILIQALLFQSCPKAMASLLIHILDLRLNAQDFLQQESYLQERLDTLFGCRHHKNAALQKMWDYVRVLLLKNLDKVCCQRQEEGRPSGPILFSGRRA